MKLSAYARQIGVTYKTAYRWWKAGKLDAYQLDTGTVIVRDPLPKSARVLLCMHVFHPLIKKAT